MLFNYSIRREVRLLIPRLPEWESKNLAKLEKLLVPLFSKIPLFIGLD